MRSKMMGQFLKKREEKLDKKAAQAELRKLGQDEDEYLESAFV
jgi:FPC/CPF motif-containing protein YcgG